MARSHPLKQMHDRITEWQREAREGGPIVMLEPLEGEGALPLESITYDSEGLPMLHLRSGQYRCTLYADEGDRALRMDDREIQFVSEGEPGSVFR